MTSNRTQDRGGLSPKALELTERQFASIAKALSDPRRFGNLSEVAAFDGPFPCRALHNSAKVSAATFSHHIKEL